MTEVAGKPSMRELVDAMEALGVHLWADDSRLRFRAPHGVLTAERRAELLARKAELLDYLATTPTLALVADHDARHEPFPLTDIQMSYLLGRRSAFAYGGVGCHAYGELTYPDLEPELVARAWRTLVARHDMLRAVIDPAGAQRVLADVPRFDVGVRDLRGRPAEEVQKCLAGVRAELDHRVYPPDRWPLVDVRVTRADDVAHLHLSIDFLIADYVSIQLLLDEFTTLYHDLDAELPALDITFRDYLLGVKRLAGSRRHDRDRDYWWRRIDGLPGAPELPVLGDRDQSGSDPVRFRRWQVQLASAEYAALQRLAGEHGVTPSVAVLTGYADVVARWSRRNRFLLNLTLLQRLPLHPQVDRLVGDFTSAVLLDVDADASATFAGRARTVQQQLWEDMDHTLVSGVQVLRELARRRGQDAALMPVVFTSALGLGGAGESGTAYEGFGYGISQTPQVWIDCQVLERAGGLVVNWDVREGVFPPGMVDDMFATFAALLPLLANGQAWQETEPAGLPSHQLARRAEVNATSASVSGALLHDGVVAQCLRTPEQPAVLTEDGTLSYGELLGRASAVAREIRRAGCGPGDLVAVLMPTGPDQVIAVLGALLAGAAYLPVDIRQPPARRTALIAGSGTRLCLVVLANADVGAPVATLAVDRLGAAPYSGPSGDATPADRAYVIYTSGSTGQPKGVVISHRGAVNTVEDINRRFSVTGSDRVLGLASLSFDLSVYDIFGPLAVGGALVLPRHDRRGDPSHWAELVRAHGVTLWNSVPAQLQMLHDYLSVTPEIALPSLRLAMLSGDWIPVRLPDQIRARLPQLRLHSLGGATEASIWSIGFPIDVVLADWSSVPYGRPLTNQTFQVLDESMRDCPDWTTGELYIGGLGVADGYLGDAELTAQRFVTHPSTGERLYRTGDLGRYLPSGDIEFLGREDFQVKIRGHRIELAEVETALLEQPTVGNAAVVVEGDTPLERRLTAFVEPARREPGDLREPDPMAGRLLESAETELSAIRSAQGGEVAVAFARELDRTALLAMIRALRQQSLFATAADRHTTAEVMRVAQVAPKHERLIRRWLNALQRHGMLAREADGRLRATVESGALRVDADTVAAAWRQVDELASDGGQRSELLGYFRTATGHLPELMRDELAPVQLLFPEGRLEIQESAYQGNFLSNTLNRLVVRAITELASGWPSGRPMQMLEVGAGVGGTSIDLIPALDRFEVEYLFTDVSQFFLNSARDRFARYSWVGYDLFDLNFDYRQQGMSAHSFDVILCANVLHYAKHAGRALAMFRELLRPGGWLVFIETTRDNYQILTSMEFLFDATVGDFEDARAGRDETFIAVPEWRQLLAESGACQVVQLSAADDALDRIGMHVFAAQFKADRTPVDPAELRAELMTRLPDYMVPNRIEVVDTIPLTGNGKADRARLRSMSAAAVPTGGRGPAGAAEPVGELESAIAALWREVLGAERVGRDEDIFSLGGDSLLAAQLVGRIRDEIPEAAGAFFDSMLRDLLEGATVAKLAAELGSVGRQVGAQPPDSDEPLVYALDEPAGDDAVSLLVPDTLGNLPAGRGWLAARLPDAGSLLELPADKLAETLAARYATLLGERPVELAGRDVGGRVAVELARQLAERGYPVTGLTVVAALPLAYTEPDELFGEYLFARSLGLTPDECGLPGEEAIAADVEAGRAGVFDAVRAEPPDWRMARIASAADLDLADVQTRYRVFRHGLAVAVCPLEPYAGDLTLVIGFDPAYWPGAAAAVEQFWRQACLGEVTVVAGERSEQP